MSLWSNDAEQALIGAILHEPTLYEDVADRLNPSDFGAHPHRLIWLAIAGLPKPDLVSVADRLRNHDQETGGREYLVQLARNATTQTPDSIRLSAGIIRDYARRRALLTAASGIHADAETLSADEAITAAHAKLQALDTGAGTDPRAVADILPGWVDDLQSRFDAGTELIGISTGLIDLDHMTGGLADGRLYVIAARPSMGKSILGLQFAMRAATLDHPALLVSLEMPETELLYRAQSALTGIDLTRLQRAHDLTDDDWPKITDAVQTLQSLPLRILDTGRLSIAELTAIAQRQQRKHGLHLLVVDYLQLMSGDGDNRTQQIGSISRGLKRIAKELKIPVVALSQLNRGLEQRGDKRPILADLRESGEIEQDADVVAMLYRDDVYNPDTKWAGVIEIILRKQRNGAIGTVRAAFRGDVARIDSLARGWVPPPDPMPKAVKGREYFV